ncbi:hypothetical protein [Haploplasma modicum]|uniref:hypothetical protein n=1 Tax=Haploplasma modicum TaxID=2150 RepID=UPI00138AECBA|nr:hypothetical protein [Haploplasma modicum]
MIRRKKYYERLKYLRCILAGLMIERDEQHPVFIVVEKRYKQIRYIEIDEYNLTSFDERNFIIYKSTLKKSFLYFLQISYPDLPKTNLVIAANRRLKRLSFESASRLIKCSIEDYIKMEEGHKTKINLKEISNNLNFSNEEFYYTFEDIFEKYNNGD